MRASHHGDRFFPLQTVSAVSYCLLSKYICKLTDFAFISSQNQFMLNSCKWSTFSPLLLALRLAITFFQFFIQMLNLKKEVFDFLYER